MSNNNSMPTAFNIVWGAITCFMAGSTAATGLFVQMPELSHFALGFGAVYVSISGMQMVMGKYNWNWWGK